MNKIEKFSIISKINHAIPQLFHYRTPLQLDHISHSENPNPTDLLKLKNHKKSPILPCRVRLGLVNLLYSISVKGKKKEKEKKNFRKKKKRKKKIKN